MSCQRNDKALQNHFQHVKDFSFVNVFLDLFHVHDD